MKTNMGKIDRIIRIIVALVAIYLGWKGGLSHTLSIVLYVIAGIMLLTSIVSSCPLYTILGINTCKTKN